MGAYLSGLVNQNSIWRDRLLELVDNTTTNSDLKYIATGVVEVRFEVNTISVQKIVRETIK